MQEKEIWKDVPGYEGYYQVSNFGRLKSFHGKKERITIGKQNSGNKNDYRCFQLSKNGKVKVIKAHRLIAETFIHNPEKKPEVNHISGLKYQNNVENLEWCTRKENSVHASKNGLSSTYWLGKGGKGYFGNKKINQYDLNGNFIMSHESASLAGKYLGVHPSNISRAAKGVREACSGFKWEYA